MFLSSVVHGNCPFVAGHTFPCLRAGHSPKVDLRRHGLEPSRKIDTLKNQRVGSTGTSTCKDSTGGSALTYSISLLKREMKKIG